ncbi:hypothetical protein [Roseococcus suduntuyensis]|uniref:Uncharacterized protein n=1 Tax=Roseococcus suduntuyensis TaxID=455361 RepID=A0A840AJ88_9PROT|nr:hypothetical protein [Roseococcus suduntuyensis]MBB3900105.1 hypothetical protein [Roseococcus suduntuyensis]
MTPTTRTLRDILEAAASARREGDAAAADWHEADAARLLRRLVAAPVPEQPEGRH